MSTLERKKLIEVAIPLDEINKEAAREKSIRQGHPSTLHLWWARRPLAACRAVIFAQLVDDPESPGAPAAYLSLIDKLNPKMYPTKANPATRRDKLFGFIEQLVKWDNSNNSDILNTANKLIKASCDGNPPAVYDPFSGGCSIPLEGQRLGLEAYGSDLNPVAVLIGKALIEIPPKFAGQAPVNPDSRLQKKMSESWPRAKGLADDVRYYGKWMQNKAWEKIGHLYPTIKDSTGNELTVIAWIWARTVVSPNPAVNVHVPLISTFYLSAKPGKEIYLEPIIEGSNYHFEIRQGKPPKEKWDEIKNGTKTSRGANFKCLVSGATITEEYVKAEGKSGRLEQRLLAIVAEGTKGRVFLPANQTMIDIANQAQPSWQPSEELPKNPRWFSPPFFGMPTYGDLFTKRQLVALNTFSELISEARDIARKDAIAAQLADDGTRLADGGTGAEAYADAIATYLSLGLGRLTDICNSFCRWESSKTQVRNLFTRHAIPMLWDFAEPNIFSNSAGNYLVSLSNLIKALERVPATGSGFCTQIDAQSTLLNSTKKLISTDPPYYDNIGYADLSDFFYVWLRKSLIEYYPKLFTTLLVPKAQELVATPYRHGSKEKAETFFLDGMSQVMKNMTEHCDTDYPVAIYYAFKQTETKDGELASTGWATFLEAIIRAGFFINGTWPLRTELSNRMIGQDTNALATSIVMVCRNRPANAGTCTRGEFLKELRVELPKAIKDLQESNLAPVDFDQAIIGPGMGVFSKYDQVLEPSGEKMPVRAALAVINQLVYEIRNEEEQELDPDTRFAVAWFESYGIEERPYGDAEGQARSKNVSVKGMEDAGFFMARGGKARLLTREELFENNPKYDPRKDQRATAWEAVQYLIINHQNGGIEAAAKLYRLLGDKAEIAKHLAYRLDSICDKKKWTNERRYYNELVIDWGEIQRVAADLPAVMKEPEVQQMTLI